MVIPSLLERYLVARLARASAFALGLLCALYLSFDLGDQGHRLAAMVGWRAVLAAALLRLPLIAAQLLPAALLLGGALATARLQQRRELQALRALGFSGARLARSAALLGLGGAAMMVLLLEGIAPRCEATADALRQYRRPSPLLGSLPQGSWRRATKSWLHRGEEPSLALRLQNGRVLERHDDLRPTLRGKLIPTRSLRFSMRGIETISPQMMPWSHWAPSAVGSLAPRGSPPRPETLSSCALLNRIHALRRAGQSERVERLVLHLRHAYPLLALVVALLLFGLLDGVPRSHRTQLSRAVGWIGLLWGLVAGAFSLGRAGIVGPGLAAWLPIGLAILLSCAWLGRNKRAGRKIAAP